MREQPAEWPILIEPICSIILHHLLIVSKPNPPLKSRQILVDPSPSCRFVKKIFLSLYFSLPKNRTKAFDFLQVTYVDAKLNSASF